MIKGRALTLGTLINIEHRGNFFGGNIHVGNIVGCESDEATLGILRKGYSREIQNDNKWIEILNRLLVVAFSLLQAIRLIIDGWWESLNK